MLPRQLPSSHVLIMYNYLLPEHFLQQWPDAPCSSLCVSLHNIAMCRIQNVSVEWLKYYYTADFSKWCITRVMNGKPSL